MTGCCWNEWAQDEASFGYAGRCHDANEWECGGVIPQNSPAQDSKCIVNNDAEYYYNQAWQTTTGSIHWYQSGWPYWSIKCSHNDLTTSGHHVVQASAAIASYEPMWLFFSGTDSMWVDSLEVELGNYNHLWGANGIIGLCLSNDVYDIYEHNYYYLQFTGCCWALKLNWQGSLQCYQPGWGGVHTLTSNSYYDELHVRTPYDTWWNRRRLSEGPLTEAEEVEMIAHIEEDIAAHPENMVDVTAMADQGKDLGFQYARTILDRALGEKSDSIKAALRENGFEEVAEYINSFPTPVATDMRPTIDDDAYARFLESFTSDVTEEIVAAIVDAKFPEKRDQERFLRMHFEQGATKAMEQEYVSALASFADAKAMLPEGSEVLAFFW